MFTSPSTMKPTQFKCAEGFVNQIPSWAEIKGTIIIAADSAVGDIEYFNNNQTVLSCAFQTYLVNLS